MSGAPASAVPVLAVPVLAAARFTRSNCCKFLSILPVISSPVFFKSLKTSTASPTGTNVSPTTLLITVPICTTFSVPTRIFSAIPLNKINADTPKSSTPPNPGISPKIDMTTSNIVLIPVLPDVSKISLAISKPLYTIYCAAGSAIFIKSAVNLVNASPVSFTNSSALGSFAKSFKTR